MDFHNYLNEIFPDVAYVIDRHATSLWTLEDSITDHNLMLIYDGKAEFTCNDEKFICSRGDLIYYKPGDLRRAHTFSNNLMKCFAVDFQYTCPIYSDSKWTLKNVSLPFSFTQRISDEYLFSELIDLFSQLTKLFLSARSRNEIKIKYILTEILSLILQYKANENYNYSITRKVDKVVNYMTENYMKKMTLQELADYAQISPSYLGSIFKKVTGKSTIDYLIDIRINKAKILLGDGFTVSQIPKLIGFNDIFYFSRVFKKHEGISPSKYIDLFRPV